MAYELPCARGNGLQQGGERGTVEVACCGDANGSAGCQDVVGGDGRGGLKTPAARLESADEEAPPRASAEGGSPAGLKGIANRADAGLIERANDGTRDTREEMRVLVGVSVGESEAGALELLDLRERFALDLVLPDGAAENTEREVAQRVAEFAAIRSQQRGDSGRIGDRRAINENDVTADAEGGACQGDGDSVVERGSGSHQCCGGDSTGVVQLGDGAIDAGREAEVIRIDDEANLHRG